MVDLINRRTLSALNSPIISADHLPTLAQIDRATAFNQFSTENRKALSMPRTPGNATIPRIIRKVRASIVFIT